MSNTNYYNINEKSLRGVLKQAGFMKIGRITNTLQGEIWRGIKNNENCVIKVTSKKLHKESCVILNGKKYKIYENIICEKMIIEYLSSFKNCPKCIIKYVGFFKSNSNYYLIMENGGNCLIEFVLNAHKMIKLGKIDICEWIKFVKLIFIEIINGIEFIHCKNICHFDISLENILINNVKITVENSKLPNEKIKFINDINIKIIDFGLAQSFDKNCNFQSVKYCGKRHYQSPEIVNKQNSFNAKLNDIFCIGVCLFMIITGSIPFKIAHKNDISYNYIKNKKLKYLLKKYNYLSYFDNNLIHLITNMLQIEKNRISLQEIKKHPWLN